MVTGERESGRGNGYGRERGRGYEEREGQVVPEWDLAAQLVERIRKRGGFVNTHAHIDRAKTITPDNLHLANAPLKEKWSLVDQIKRESSVQQIADRMSLAVEDMIAQGVQVMGTFIDVDDVIEDKAMLAGEIVRSRYKDDILIKFINQTLKGVMTPESRMWFDEGAQFVDIIGGLPGKDKGHEAEHLDYIMETAHKLGKMVHVHVDQNNDPNEFETELLVKKTVEHGLEGRVVGIHGISIAAQPAEYRQGLYKDMAAAQVAMISCPTAWIDSRRNEVLTPTHNSIVPVEEMIPYGIPIGIGSDNIADVYKPFTTGDMWTELRFLLEACHYYDTDQLVNIATSNGRKILGVA